MGTSRSAASVYTGNTSATPNTVTEIAFTKVSQSLLMENIGASTIQVSFDGQATWYPVDAGKSFGLDIGRASIHVKAAAASVPYRCVASF